MGRAIRGGQPWIYRDALAASPRIADGAVVLVAGGDGRPLARGFWDATSPIAVRVLGGEGDLDVGAEIDRRVTEALARRLRAIDRAQTNAFRWAHGEADALPGVHVDVYGAALNIRYDGGGARAFYRDLPARLREVAAERSHGRGHLRAPAAPGRRSHQGRPRTKPSEPCLFTVRSPTVRSKFARTGSSSAPTCDAARRAACFSISARTARWSGRWRRAAAC